MSNLAGKSFLSLSFILTYSANFQIISAQPPKIYDYICDPTSNYSTNSPFQTNLQRTLDKLPTTNSGSGFFNSSSGQNSDKVNAIALCRGDIDPISCNDCMNNSIVQLRQLCPNQKSASGYYDNCTIKYSNEDLLGRIGKDFRPVTGGSGKNATDVDGFHKDVLELMDGLTNRAAGGGLVKKYASGSKTRSDSKIIYGLVQCAPDLSMELCSECLKTVVGRISGCCYGNMGARALLPSCNMRYEDYQFYNGDDVTTPTPIHSQPPLSSLQPPPPATGGGNEYKVFVDLKVMMAVVSTILIF